MGIKEQVSMVKKSLDGCCVNIIAATKYMSIEETVELVEAGITNLGENRTDLFLEKYNALKDYPNLKWHFFGVVQTRKIKDIVNKIDCLHSLDRVSVAMDINKKLTKPLDCFIQVNISEEATKQGIQANKLKTFLVQLAAYDKIRIVGLMCIPKLTYDELEIRNYFKKMKDLQTQVQKMNLDYAPCTRLSMGMSNDYLIALDYGATDIRLGRIFLKTE